MAGIDQRQAGAGGKFARQRLRERPGNVAELANLVAEDVFGNAAGERQRGRGSFAWQRLGEQERSCERIKRRSKYYVRCRRGEPLHDAPADRLVGKCRR